MADIMLAEADTGNKQGKESSAKQPGNQNAILQAMNFHAYRTSDADLHSLEEVLHPEDQACLRLLSLYLSMPLVFHQAIAHGTCWIS